MRRILFYIYIFITGFGQSHFLFPSMFKIENRWSNFVTPTSILKYHTPAKQSLEICYDVCIFRNNNISVQGDFTDLQWFGMAPCFPFCWGTCTARPIFSVPPSTEWHEWYSHGPNSLQEQERDESLLLDWILWSFDWSKQSGKHKCTRTYSLSKCKLSCKQCSFALKKFLSLVFHVSIKIERLQKNT